MTRWAAALVIVLASCPPEAVEATTPSAAPPCETPDEQRRAIAEALVERLAAGEYDRATAPFDRTMRALLSAKKLQAVWEGLVEQRGPLLRTGKLRTTRERQWEIVFVTCEFERGKLDLKAVFDSELKVAGLFFVTSGEYHVPNYVRPDSFRERELKFGAGLLWRLPGTLSLPVGEGTFPAVVLVHGSGPHDRDESIGPNKPFRDLAHGLASRGVAVFRYEKRTQHHKLAMSLLARGLTVREETIDDAAAAVDAVRGVEGIDGRRVFVVGHSLGGMLIPRIAEANPEIAGFVSLAGAARSLDELTMEQVHYLIGLDGDESEEEREAVAKIEQEIAAIRSPDLTASDSGNLLGAPASYWLDLRKYDPVAAMGRVRRPVLFLQGERDYQVTLASDFAMWRAALGDRPQVKFISYPNLNHLFMAIPPAAGERLAPLSTPDEYLAEANVAEEVVRDIAAWILATEGAEDSEGARGGEGR